MNDQSNKPKRKHRKFARFRKTYHRMQESFGGSYLIRIGLAIVGLFFLLIGFVMLFTPGPGVLFIILGLICLSAISYRVAHYFDKLEDRFKHWFNSKRKKK